MTEAVRRAVWGVGSGAILLAVGCSHDEVPTPPRAAIPPTGTYTTVAEVPPKPLPFQPPPGQPGYYDEPLVNQPTPEQTAFVRTYEAVGHPRVSVFVNRTLSGNLVATNTGGRVLRVEESRRTTGAVTVESGQNPMAYDYYGRPVGGGSDKFQTPGPAEISERTEVYLSPGEYDEANARRVDYDAVESVLTDWMGANGRVTLVSPRLSEGQAKRLEKGDSGVLAELSKKEQVDVLIQVQAKATRQTPQGLSVRLIGEAIDTAGGTSLGRAFVDVPPPLEKTTINEYTRFLARKLMDGMTQTWSAPRPGPQQPSSQTPPAQQSSPQAAPPATEVAPPAAPAPVPSAVPSTQP